MFPWRVWQQHTGTWHTTRVAVSLPKVEVVLTRVAIHGNRLLVRACVVCTQINRGGPGVQGCA